MSQTNITTVQSDEPSADDLQITDEAATSVVADSAALAPPTTDSASQPVRSPPPLSDPGAARFEEEDGGVGDERRRSVSCRSGVAIQYSYYNPRPKNKCIGGSGGYPVFVVCSGDAAALWDRNSADKGKYSVFFSLLKAYRVTEGALYGQRLRVVPPQSASASDLTSFHDEDYVSVLEDIENFPAFSEQTEDEKEALREHGLLDDCPIFDGLWPYCLAVAGGSLQCAELLKAGRTRIAVHFGGGRHHASAARAGGFCYVNDVVLCIEALRPRFERVLYLDLDLHHPDAVQDAYYGSRDVFVASLHCRDAAFFPQSGPRRQCGAEEAPFHTLNVAVPGAVRLRDDALLDIVCKICHRVRVLFQPEAVVICAGADGLRSDPHCRWDLSIGGLARAVQAVLTQIDAPTVILGGGGYNPIDTAKCWTKIVCNAAAIAVPDEIPFHDNFSRFAPQYLLHAMSTAEGAALPAASKKKKASRAHVHAMQLIYAHLNNFERLFVERNLSALHRAPPPPQSAAVRNKTKGRRIEQPPARDERQRKGADAATAEGPPADRAVAGGPPGGDGKSEADSHGAAEVGSKRPLSGNTTNSCRSRRKRRKV